MPNTIGTAPFRETCSFDFAFWPVADRDRQEQTHAKNNHKEHADVDEERVDAAVDAFSDHLRHRSWRSGDPWSRPDGRREREGRAA